MNSIEKAIKKLAEFTHKFSEDEDNQPFWEDEDDAELETEAKAKEYVNLLKIAASFEEWEEWEDPWESESENIQDVWDTSIKPENIESWLEEDLPEEFKMEQLSPEDYDAIIRLDKGDEGVVVEDPITGKEHYDVEPDFTILDEDFEEKSTEPPSEVEDILNQLAAKIEENKELEEEETALAYFHSRFNKES